MRSVTCGEGFIQWIWIISNKIKMSFSSFWKEIDFVKKKGKENQSCDFFHCRILLGWQFHNQKKPLISNTSSFCVAYCPLTLFSAYLHKVTHMNLICSAWLSNIRRPTLSGANQPIQCALEAWSSASTLKTLRNGPMMRQNRTGQDTICCCCC